MKTVIVRYRFANGTYVARAGRGKKTKTASCTSTAALACRRAAAKYFGLDESNVQGPADIVLAPPMLAPGEGEVSATLPNLPEAGGAA